jgi:hypothetical protein
MDLTMEKDYDGINDHEEGDEEANGKTNSSRWLSNRISENRKKMRT